MKHKLNPRRLITQLKHTLLLKLTLNSPLKLLSKLQPLKNPRRKLIKSATTLATTAIELPEKVPIIPTKESNRINIKKVKMAK